MRKFFIILGLISLAASLLSIEQMPAYFQRLGTNLYQDMTSTVTEMPLAYKNMFAVPFARVNLKTTKIQLGFLAGSFLLDVPFNDFSRDVWEPICNKPVRHIRLPLPILNLTHKGEKYWFEFKAPNTFHYDFVFLTFAQYGYLSGLLLESETMRDLSHDLIQATIYSFIFAQPLKPLIGRGRPIRNQEDWDDIGPWVWGKSSFNTAGQYTAFPSFHATFYSAYCTVLMDYLGARWAGPLLGAFFFFQQPSHVHWLSDIVGAGLFGYWLASSILDTPDKYEQDQPNTSIMLSPYRGGIALQLDYKF